MYFEVDGARTFAAGRITGATDAPVVVLVHGAAMDHSIWFTTRATSCMPGATSSPSTCRRTGSPTARRSPPSRTWPRGSSVASMRSASLARRSPGTEGPRSNSPAVRAIALDGSRYRLRLADGGRGAAARNAAADEAPWHAT
ncbi:MAG: hypothetical protein R3E65_12290 [Steroidobacteraceae bacterium]